MGNDKQWMIADNGEWQTIENDEQWEMTNNG